MTSDFSCMCRRSALRSDWRTCIECEKFLYPIGLGSTTLSHYRQWWNGISKLYLNDRLHEKDKTIPSSHCGPKLMLWSVVVSYH